MKLAIQEAEKGYGFVAPNPVVGCVVLDSRGDLIGKGFHRIFGGDHAEVDAIKTIKNKDQLKGATVYVTLEPCAHEGKTPSCAKFLATLPIQKVVYGLKDPHPLVSGQGAEILRAAKIEVEVFDRLKSDLEELAEIFLHNQRSKSVFVALKVATSLDGQLAHISGDSHWLTGEEARLHAHALRARYDAVVVGSGTVRADNPSLNIRHPHFMGHKNKVVIVDSRGESLVSLKNANILKTHSPEDVYLATLAGVDVSKLGVRQIICDKNESGQVSLTHLLENLYKEKIYSVFVEGGASLLSSFLQQNLVHRYYQYIAPQIIGAKSGLSFTKNFSIESLPARRELSVAKTISLGKDLLITGRLDEFKA
jgi:diaminohydroxyphosphoribosylaminopyrimidine deaminase / 5-amino-6-(5-phosphoribosylamino)uracil reductase